MKKIDSRICAYWLMHFLRLPIFIFLLLPFVIKAQNTGTANSQSIIVGFYNFENYYDTTNQLNVADEEFLPNSVKGYNSVRYKNKSAHLASVIYGIGKINNANGISLLGIAEVENKMVLKKATQALARNRNLLIFGEGITDDIFERRLKPIKKGAMRIGFTALEDLDWKVQIQVQGIGINYTDPGLLRSDVLIAAAQPIVLNDYKDAYLENPGKVITELNRELENRMQAQITHVRSDEHVRLHEHIMMLNRKGMNARCYDPKLSLQARWEYSRQLADKMNGANEDLNNALCTFERDHLNPYLKQLHKNGLSEEELYSFAKDQNWKLGTLLKLFIQLPFFLIGLVHFSLPHLFVKRFVERTFKRKVFWSSSKMGMLLVLLPIWNLLLFLAASSFISLPSYIWILFFLCVLPWEFIPIFKRISS